MSSSRRARLAAASVTLALLAASATAQYSGRIYAVDGSLEALVDLDGDGRLDAITERSVALGLPGGHFATAQGFVVQDFSAFDTIDVEVGDMNGDGIPDLVAMGDAEVAPIGVYLGDGAGGVASVQLFGPASSHPDSQFTLGDVDGDGALDVIGHDGGSSSTLYVLYGDGAGGLSSPVTFAADPWLGIGICAEDLDGDGHLDVALATRGFIGTTCVLRGDGAGTLLPKSGFTAFDPWQGGRLECDDIDGDGVLDLFTAKPSRVWRGNGDATFTLLFEDPAVDAGVLADFDGDGFLDVVGSSEISFGDGTGAFVPSGTEPFPPMFGLSAPVVADVDQDGNPDVTVTIAEMPTSADERNFLHTARGDGAGGLVADGPLVSGVGGAGGAGEETTAAAFGDLNADGFADAVLANETEVLSSLGNGDGTFATASSRALDLPSEHLSLDDANGDGNLDAFLCTRDLLEDEVRVFFGDGSGQLQSPLILAVGPDPSDLAHGDLDGDGVNDLVVGRTPLGGGPPNDIAVFLGDGAGGFGPKTTFLVPGTVPALDLGDVDEDGTLDVVFSFGKTDVRWMAGDGSGALLPPVVVADSFGTEDVALEDFDGDGHLDIGLWRDTFDPIRIHHGDGTGAFGAGVDYDTSAFGDVRFGDVTGDGLADLVTGNTIVAVFAADGGGGLEAPLYFDLGRPFPALADADGDGRLDLLGASGSEVAARLNLGPQELWSDLGEALAGTFGEPSLEATGALLTGGLVTLQVSNGLPAGSGTLIAGASMLHAPLKGGVLVPAPDMLLGPLPLDGTGNLPLTGPVPPGLPSGTTLVLQVWIPDAGGPAGFAATNAVSNTVP